jgi:hypothetical protein
LQFFRLKPYKTAEFKVAGQAWLVDKQSLSPKTSVLGKPPLISNADFNILAKAGSFAAGGYS